ncbi:cation:proton antiporter, partial [bacterium]|nr:cation:proton antiporter [bacterium]
MPTFTSASHEDILLLLVRIAILLLAARTLGELAQRLNQPAVLGELFAGVLLGPSMLSGWFPVVHEWFIPQTNVQGYLLELMSLIGAMFLLLLTGLETEIELIKKHAKTAIYIAFGGLILPFVSGFCFAYFLPESLLVSPDKKFIFAIFIATALSVSAIPVIAKILIELKLMKREIGQTIVAAGVVDDTIAWIFLSIIASLTVNQTLDFSEVLKSVGSVLVFIIFSFTIGKWLVKKALDFVQDEVLSVDRLLTLIVVMTFLWGTFTQAIHLEPVLGAFVIGILFGQLKRLPKNVIEKLQSISMSIFVPIFFAVAGLKVNILGLLEPRLALISLAAILVATFSKILGAYLGARFFCKKDHWTSLTYGAGLNARGAMQIIIATIGLSLGILSQEMFSIIILVAIVTSLTAPLMLKFTVKRVKLTQEETKRLQ